MNTFTCPETSTDFRPIAVFVDPHDEYSMSDLAPLEKAVNVAKLQIRVAYSIADTLNQIKRIKRDETNKPLVAVIINHNEDSDPSHPIQQIITETTQQPDTAIILLIKDHRNEDEVRGHFKPDPIALGLNGEAFPLNRVSIEIISKVIKLLRYRMKILPPSPSSSSA